MKLTSLQFTFMIAILLVLAGSSYQLGRESLGPRVIVIHQATPAPERVPTEITRVYIRSGNIYTHENPDCVYNAGSKTTPQRQPCPRCSGG